MDFSRLIEHAFLLKQASLGTWGHPLKGTCQEKKVVRKQEEVKADGVRQS
jgi:hypothetical protein